MTACHPEHHYSFVLFCVHSCNIRETPQINALSGSLWRRKCCPCVAPPSLLLTFSVPLEGLLFTSTPSRPPPLLLHHFLLSWPCLRASPLEGQVNRRPGSAQIRLVLIHFPVRLFISCMCWRQCFPLLRYLSDTLCGNLEMKNTS